MTSMSALHRRIQLDSIQKTEWDVVIIGGGITGAGILLDAASRGLKTLLLEKHDFAWGTSSKSTKLIHGGLRYLKQLEIRLVKEVGSERAIVYQNAMHIVRPEKMLLPIVKNGSLSKLTSSIGLWFYDWVADVEKEERRTMLDKDETLRIEEKLNPDILLGGGLYYEYRTDDARLTIEVIKKAIDHGATALNYAEVTGFHYQGNRLDGLNFTDSFDNSSYQLAARCIVNATGPWVDKIRKLDEPHIVGKRLRLTKGVHIVVPKDKLSLNQSVYFDVPQDDRMIFCIPRNEVVYMGTTDTNFEDAIDQPTTTSTDVDYILAAVNHMFPGSDLKLGDVISSWAGLRPLIHEEGKTPSELSRKDEIFVSKRGLISIAGGKLTGYRKMSDRILHEIEKNQKIYGIDNEIGPSKSKGMKISGNIFESEEEMENFILSMIEKHPPYKKFIRNLFFKYGSNIEQIIEYADQHNIENNPTAEVAINYGEIKYAVEKEMVHTLSDFCIRRTGMLYFEPVQMMYELDQYADHMQEICEWDDQKKAEEIQLVKLAHKTALDFN